MHLNLAGGKDAAQLPSNGSLAQSGPVDDGEPGNGGVCLQETPNAGNLLRGKVQRFLQLPLAEPVEGGVLDGEGNEDGGQLGKVGEPGEEPVDVLVVVLWRKVD